MIDGKSFFDVPVKKKEEAYENTIEMSRDNDYATVTYWIMNTLQNIKLIARDLSGQTELENPDLKQQIINFIGKLKKR